MNAWTKGSTRRWRQLRTTVINRQTQPGQPLQCQRCHTPVHHRCTPTGCPTCIHIHHLDGHPPHTIHHVHPNRLALWCAACNMTVGEPNKHRQVILQSNPMKGVDRR